MVHCQDFETNSRSLETDGSGQWTKGDDSNNDDAEANSILVNEKTAVKADDLVNGDALKCDTSNFSVLSVQNMKSSHAQRGQQSKRLADRRTSSLKMFELYKYADQVDIVLMFVGTVMCLSTGFIFPLMFWMYQDVTNTFIDIGLSSKSPIGLPETSSQPVCTPQSSTNSSAMLFTNVRETIKWYVLVGFVSIICHWIGFSFWMITGERQIRRIRCQLFRSILSQEIGWFDLQNPGNLIQRLITDSDRIRDGLGDKCADFISLLARFIGGLAFAFIKGWKLSLVFLSLSPLIIFSFNILIRVTRKYTKQEIQMMSSANNIAQEVLGGIRTVTAFGGQKKAEDRYSIDLDKAKTVGIQKSIALGLCHSLIQVVLYMAFAITFWYGPYLVRNECQNYSGGTVMVVFIACLQSTFSISQIFSNVQAYVEALGSARVVFNLIDRVSNINALTHGGKRMSCLTGDIEFCDVSFTYPARKDVLVLNRINMKVSSGQIVALVGVSGCGKSTIIQLLQRLYDSNGGCIFIDGQDIKTLDVAWLRSQIGIVSQEPALFTGTIEENIRMGKPDATDDEVIAAARMAHAHDFITDLCNNYKTSSGDKLSGGQKQRIAIARALIANPRILLLDEATSALDTASAQAVQNALNTARKGRTTIVIAHRMHTIRNADCIFVIDKGEVIQCGTHSELMSENGRYRDLVIAERDASDDGEFETFDSTHFRDLPHTSSMTSLNSEVPDQLIDADNKNTRCGYWPFIFQVLHLNLPELHWLIIGSIASLVFGGVTPLFAVLLSNIYELFTEQDLHRASVQTGSWEFLIFCIGVVGGLCQFLSSVALAKSGEALTKRMRIISFASMLRQEMNWFDRQENNIGALVTQLSSDTGDLKNLSGLCFGVICNALGATICTFTVVLVTGWKLGLVLLLFVPLIVFSAMMQGQQLSSTKRHASELSRATSGDPQGGEVATEAIERIRTVVGLHREKHFIFRYENNIDATFRRSMMIIPLQAFGSALANSLLFFLHAAAFGYGSFLIENGEMQFQNVYRIFSVINFGAASVGRSLAMVPDCTRGRLSATRILALNNRSSQIDPYDPRGAVLASIDGKIEFQQVQFAYSSRSKMRILKNVGLCAAPHQRTALVGRSGSGKSTCAALILRLYDPDHGSVCLDGHDIRSLNVSWLRSQIGLVQQEPVLFNMSIRDNIAYGVNDRTTTQEEIEEAARKAYVHDFIVSLPHGYDTLCGFKGNQISGGQKQRLAIARALIRQPKVLIFDEATSALDSQSEKRVQETLHMVQNDHTCLTIAHRLSTIRNCEQIIVIDQGHVKESGTHENLMRRRGTYYELNVSRTKR